MKVTVRKATLNDAQGVADVLNSVIAEGELTAFDQPFSLREERDFISALGRRSALFVAESQGETVGVQSIDLLSGFAQSLRHVATMGTWIRSGSRGLGIGKRLAAQSFSFAHRHDYRKILIQVLAGNRKALRFYRSLGFHDVGVAHRHVWLSDGFHDSVFLEKML